MAIAQKTDYVDGGLALLREAYKNRPLITALFTSFLNHGQAVENAIAALSANINLGNAYGATLDGYGQIVGVDRNGLDDASYRLFLYAAIAANHGDATTDTVVLLAKKLFQTDTVFCKTPLRLRRTGGIHGAFISLSIGSPQLPQSLWPIAEKLLQQNVGGAVRLNSLGTFASSGCFSFASDTSPQPAYVQGFAPVTNTSNGSPFAGLLDN